MAHLELNGAPGTVRACHHDQRDLTAERILEATEEALRRHGPAKATVVDVARALGVSHGSVYRHFRTKAALREAVTKRWLDRASGQLSGIVAADRVPEDRRCSGLARRAVRRKRREAGEDPELFATYMVLTDENGTAVGEHITDLETQRPASSRPASRRVTSPPPTRRPRPARSSRPRAASTTPVTRGSGGAGHRGRLRGGRRLAGAGPAASPVVRRVSGLSLPCPGAP
ncbi:hypothetical protein GCM10029978_120990 [Actinoallomurus acanthiterrae]